MRLARTCGVADIGLAKAFPAVKPSAPTPGAVTTRSGAPPAATLAGGRSRHFEIGQLGAELGAHRQFENERGRRCGPHRRDQSGVSELLRTDTSAHGLRES